MSDYRWVSADDRDLPVWLQIIGILVGLAAFILACVLVYSWWGWGGLLLSLLLPITETIGYLAYMIVMLPLGLAYFGGRRETAMNGPCPEGPPF